MKNNLSRQLIDSKHLLENIEDPIHRAQQFYLCGYLARCTGATIDAQHYLKEASFIYTYLDDLNGFVQTYIELAYCDRLLGNYTKAFAYLRVAHRLIRKSKQKEHCELLALITYTMALCLDDIGRKQRSILCLQYLYRLATNINRTDLQLYALAWLSDGGDYIDAEIRENMRQRCVTESKNIKEIFPLVIALSSTHRKTGLSEREHAYKLALESGIAELIIIAGNSYAGSLRINNQKSQALDIRKKMIDFAFELDYLRLEALCQHDIGIFYKSEGNWLLARQSLIRAATIQRQIKSWRITMCLAELGVTLLNTGEYDLGLKCVSESYFIHKKHSNIKGMRNQARNIGIFHHRLNEYAKALEWYEQSRKLAIQYKGEEQITYCTGNIASLYYIWSKQYTGEENKKLLINALEFVNIAIGRTGKIVLSQEGYIKQTLKGNALNSYIINLGRKADILLALGKAKEAIGFARKSYFLTKKHGYNRRIPKRLISLSKIYAEMGDINRSLQLATFAIRDSLKNHGQFTFTSITAYRVRANLRSKVGDLVGSLADYESAIELVQKSLTFLQGENTSINAFSDWEGLYTSATLVALELNQSIRAFEIQELGRVPVLRRFLSTAFLKPPATISSILLQKEKELLSLQANLWATIMGSEDQEDSNVEGTYVQLKEVNEQIMSVWNEIEAITGTNEYVYLRRGQALSYNQIHQDLLSYTDSNVVLCQYLLLKEYSLIFIIKKDFLEPKIIKIDVSLYEIRKFINDSFREDSISSIRKNNNDKNILSSELNDNFGKLIKPIIDSTKEGDIIWLVPNDVLHRIPLQSIKVDNSNLYLIDRNPVFYTPSASIIKYCVNKSTNKYNNILVLADSRYDNPLPHLQAQARTVYNVFDVDSEIFVGNEVTKPMFQSFFINQQHNIDIIHLACHGYFLPNQPLLSGILLAKNDSPSVESSNVIDNLADNSFDPSVLTAKDVMQLTLRVNLVTLSSCETGISERYSGDELIGLSRAFLYAGASSVVASLWSVEDLSTSFLMQRFYELLRSGYTKAEALQKAQVYLREMSALDAIELCIKTRQFFEQLGQNSLIDLVDENIAQIRFVVGDFIQAKNDYEQILQRINDYDHITRIRQALVVIDLTNLASEPYDYHKKIYEHFLHWSPFILIGDWK